MAVGGYVLFGVVPVSAGDGNALAPDTELVIAGDLGAVLRPASFERVEMCDAQLQAYEEVVESVFERQTILPAPFGVVFRNTDHVTRWLQMHYLTLTEAMHLVEGRCEHRMHLRANAETLVEDEPDPVATEAAMELYRTISREADAAVMLRRPALHAVLSGAFLIDRSEWEAFTSIITAQARKYDAIRVEQSGPWPPYDFVRMDLGS
ncbi:MAG TPA: GvpL/GvpF family gas vesicle protein [Gemmatimonadaceae bacterium]|nr:GvpL/GvpF family gas vesicle protein [Gemmatimonadaceae bacterium]